MPGLESLTPWGAAAGAASNIVGGVINNLFAHNAAKQQYKYQRNLNEQQFEQQQSLNATQQEYAQQNAHNDYLRQRALTRDSYSLSQQGKQAAGINLAFSDGQSSVAGVNGTAAPSAGSASAGSAPAIQTFDTGIGGVGNSVQNYLQNMMQVRYQNEQMNLLREQTNTQRIENLTKYQRDLVDLLEKMNNAENIEEKTRYQKLYNDLSDKYLELQMSSEASSAESRADMNKIDKTFYNQFKESDLQQKLADIQNKLEDTELKKEERSRLRKEQYQIEWSIRKIQAEIPKIESETENINADTKGKKLDNDYNEASLPYRLSEALNNAAVSDYKVIQEQLKTIPHDLYSFMQYTCADAFDRARAGRASEEDYKRIGKFVKLISYDKASQEVRSWLSTFASVLSAAKGGSPGGSGSSNNNSPHVVTYSPQNY